MARQDEVFSIVISTGQCEYTIITRSFIFFAAVAVIGVVVVVVVVMSVVVVVMYFTK